MSARKIIDLVIEQAARDSRSAADIAARTGMEVSDVYDYARAKDNRMSRMMDTIDSLVEKGLSLKEIGFEAGLSETRVRQYVTGTGQYSYWIDRRREFLRSQTHQRKLEVLQRKDYLAQLISLLKARFEQFPAKESWPYKKALEYCRYSMSLPRLSNRRNYSFRRLVDMFKAYQDAKIGTRNVTLTKLGSILGSDGNHGVIKILKSLGLSEPWHHSVRIPEEVKKNIKYAAYTKLSPNDIAYLLGCSIDLVVNNSPRQRRRKVPILIGSGYDQDNKLTYRIASQIYEAQDLAFNEKEIAELLDIDDGKVIFAQNNRDAVGSEIIKALKILHPDKKVEGPYKSAVKS